MAIVTISKAAQLAGLSRTALYKTYINTGKISTSKNHQGKPCIDTSELIRVFGTLQDVVNGDSQPLQMFTPTITPENVPNAHLKHLEQQLQEAKEREQALKAEFAEREAWYQERIKSFDNALKLLEAPKPQPYPRLWWQFWK